MGRSVSYPNNTDALFFTTLDFSSEEQDEQTFVWAAFVSALRDSLKSLKVERVLELNNEEKFIGREDQVILSNELMQIGVSEYCGIVSLWAVPVQRDEDEEQEPQALVKSLWLARLPEMLKQAIRDAGYEPMVRKGWCLEHAL